jgi:hypothetical protein
MARGQSLPAVSDESTFCLQCWHRRRTARPRSRRATRPGRSPGTSCPTRPRSRRASARPLRRSRRDRPPAAPAISPLRSCHDTKLRLWRIRWTMQVCTMALGNTAVMASGKPLSPSTTANRTSSTPRVLSSFMTRSQNLAPSLCSIHRPRTCLCPSQSRARARWTALFLTTLSSRILTRRASKKTTG